MANNPLTLNIDEVSPLNGDGFLIKLSAFSSRGNQPVAGANIQFYVAGNKLPSVTETDENGRASDEDVLTTTAKSILVMAQIVGTTIIATKTITLSRETKKSAGKPHEMFVRAVGKDGHYILSIFVTDEAGKPCDGTRVQIMDDHAAPGFQVRNVLTDTHGTVREEDGEKLKVIFGEEERKIIVKVPCIKEEVLTLFGPSKWPRPPAIPEPEKDDLSGGFLETIFSAWEKGSDDLEAQRRSNE